MNFYIAVPRMFAVCLKTWIFYIAVPSISAAVRLKSWNLYTVAVPRSCEIKTFCKTFKPIHKGPTGTVFDQ